MRSERVKCRVTIRSVGRLEKWMPASRRRVSAWIALGLLTAAVGSLAASTPAQAATNPITFAVKVGYAGFIKAQQWMPVTVDVTNAGVDVDGTLEISAAVSQNGPPIGSAIYQTHISLPSGATKHLRTYLVEDQGPAPISVSIVQNGRVLATANSPGGTLATTLIGVLSDEPTGLDSFSAVHPAGISANVVHLSLDDVGASGILLRAFDLLVIDDFATDTLTVSQRSAVTDFVQNGGALLLGCGGSWHKTLGGLSSTIVPMAVQGTTSLNAVRSLGGLSGVEIATGALTQGAHAWLSEGGKPLLVESFIGSGPVTLATFDWNQDPVASWTGASVLLRQILVRSLYSSPAALGSTFGGMNGPFGGSGTSVTERSNALGQALASLPALDLPSLVVIGLLVLAYVLLVGPINYFALRALNRRALAWVTVPLIAILASAGAFGAGVFTKGRSVQTNQISIIHLEPGWDRAYAESYTGILAPTRGDYEVAVAGNQVLVGPIGFNNGGPVGPNIDVIRINDDNNSIAMPGMTAFALRGFATEGVVDAPRLVGSAKLVNGKLTGTVRNDSNMRFTDLVVLAGDGYQTLPALAPGATANFSLTPKVSNPFNGPPAFANIYPSQSYFGGPQPNQTSDAAREALVKTSVLSLVAGSGFNNATIEPMVVAWTKQPYEQIKVSGSQPHSTAETAVVLPLAVDSIGAGTLPAGLVMSRFTDVEGDAQSGPPGGVQMQNGTVTFDFTPHLAPGTHLTDPTLDSTNQSPKGMVPGSGQGVRAEFWDWTQSAWVPVNYVALGVTALPPAAVNSTSGEVRLHLTATGNMIVAGSISLTGTVK
jgi:hypothetical protein